MASMTQDFGRIAGGIAASRRMRAEATVARRQEVGSRHRAVGHDLRELTKTRKTMSRDQRRGATAVLRKRKTEVETLLRQFHRNHEKLAVAARASAVAFMRDLTSRVATLRDTFNASQKARAKACHDLAGTLQVQLAGYRRDRHDAGGAWRTPARRASMPASASTPERQRSSHGALGGNAGSP